MNYFLMKSEEADYSIDDLKRDKRTAWVGVRNYQARNYMRDTMKVGDMVIFYHSNGNPSGAVGIGKVASAPYPDETQFDKKSKYYYPRATREKPVWILVDIVYVKKFEHLVSIADMRGEQGLENMIILQPGSRLSVTPLTKKEFETLDNLGSNKQIGN